ncbi:MAG TPA: tetratricopeptide repeat-containing serine protease family protein, partial [Allocoleopsis sp.]
MGDIDKIARQITVRIDVKNNGNGSGVIVAKNGNTYYVLTASHVVLEEDSDDKTIYPTINIITSYNQKHSLTAQKVTVLKTGKNQDVEVDLAVVEFTSDKTYQVATLGKYELKDNPWVFVSGFPGNLNERLLTGGVVQKEELKDFAAKDQSSLSTEQGYGLLYTNISYGGMSGGAVLDHQGRLVGINTASENEFINNKEVNLGQSIGIPISTFISLANGAKIEPQWLKIATNKPSEIDINDIFSVRELLFDLKNPSQDDLTEWMNYGNQLWRSFQYEKSVIAYDRAIELIKKQPDYSKGDLARAYYGKGLSLWYLGRNNKNKKAREETFNEAVKYFDLATQNDSKFYQAWRYKGMVLSALKQYSESLKAYDKAIEINQTNFVVLVERGTVLGELKDYQKAIARLNEAIRIKDNFLAY